MDFPISDNESRELIARFREGDQRAFNKLIARNQGLVVKIARQYSQHPDFVNDLIQEGNLGLIRALQKFNLNGKTVLSTYASIWIKSNIETYISKSSYGFTASQASRKLAFKVTKMYKSLINQSVPDPQAIGRISKELKLEHSAVSKLAALQSACTSMNERRFSGSEENREEVQDAIKSAGASVEDRVDFDIIQSGVEDHVSKLPGKQRDAVSLFYGLGRYPELTSFADIARHIGVTREYARILYNNGMKGLAESKNALQDVAA